MKSRSAKVAYGVGNLGTALFFHTIGAYLIFFTAVAVLRYTDVVRLDPGLVGLAFAISYGVWNAINDPLVGYLSDRTRTRWGRRIPYILFGAPVLFLCFVLVWSPPMGGQPLITPSHPGIFLYFAIAIALFDLLYTAVSVPYIALFPEMYEGLGERPALSSAEGTEVSTQVEFRISLRIRNPIRNPQSQIRNPSGLAPWVAGRGQVSSLR